MVTLGKKNGVLPGRFRLDLLDDGIQVRMGDGNVDRVEVLPFCPFKGFAFAALYVYLCAWGVG